MKRTFRRLTVAELFTLRTMNQQEVPMAQIMDVLKRPAQTLRRWLKRFREGFVLPSVYNVLPKGAKRLQIARRRDNAGSAPTRNKAEIALRRSRVRFLATQTVKWNGKVRPRYPTAQQIATQLAVRGWTPTAVSKWTVARDLIAINFVSRVRKNVPTTSLDGHKRRLAFAKRWKGRRWSRNVFSDEKVFTTNDCGPHRMWVRRGGTPLGREKYRYANRVMVWAAIGKDFLTWTVLRNPMRASGTDDDKKLAVVTSDSYRRRVLPTVVPHLLAKKLVFMQDGAKPHTAKATLSYLEGEGVQLMAPWPARSPDLNPIETLWALAARKVSEHFPTTYDELRAAVDAAMTDIRDNHMAWVNKLVRSFPVRCSKVLAVGGRYAQ
jgi:transposase